MRISIEYDTSRDPPAPVVLMGVGSPINEANVLVPFLVDSGADLSVIPREVISSLSLQRVGRIQVQGFGGEASFEYFYAVRINFMGRGTIVRVIPGEEGILGRDLLQSLVCRLDGPRSALTLTLRRSLRFGRGQLS
ncbi:MAG: aspartyl protease family protein [Deltaproteobacteria bacterium]|nr:aspartyl protease family protein [Deltaproteobacteria bacterium]